MQQLDLVLPCEPAETSPLRLLLESLEQRDQQLPASGWKPLPWLPLERNP